MISNEILQKVDLNQFFHVGRNLVNICPIGKKHPFVCAFWSTKICANHTY